MQDSSTTIGLLERAVRGDEHAFARLFDRYELLLRKHIQHRMDAGLSRRFDPSDVIQETRLTTFKRLRDFHENRPMPLAIWILKMAIQQLADLQNFHRRSAKRSVNREQSGENQMNASLSHSLTASQLTPSGIVSAEEEARRVRIALNELPDDDREILLMRYVEQFSNREIAYVLDITDAAASRRHGMALIRLRRTLEQLFPDIK